MIKLKRTLEGNDMPFCSKCGLELEPDDSFCPNCGAVITSIEHRNRIPVGEETAPINPTPNPYYTPPPAPYAPTRPKHTGVGYAGIFAGLIGLALYFIPIFPSDAPIVAIIDIFVGGIAGAWGSNASERGDKNGVIAMILGVIVVMLSIYTIYITL